MPALVFFLLWKWGLVKVFMAASSPTLLILRVSETDRLSFTASIRQLHSIGLIFTYGPRLTALAFSLLMGRASQHWPFLNLILASPLAAGATHQPTTLYHSLEFDVVAKLKTDESEVSNTRRWERADPRVFVVHSPIHITTEVQELNSYHEWIKHQTTVAAPSPLGSAPAPASFWSQLQRLVTNAIIKNKEILASENQLGFQSDSLTDSRWIVGENWVLNVQEFILFFRVGVGAGANPKRSSSNSRPKSLALGDSDSTKLDQTEAIRLFGESDCFTFVPKIVVFESVMSRLQFGVMTIELQSCLQNLMQKCSRSRGNPVVQSPQNPGFHQGDDVPCAQYWVMVVVWPTFGRGSSVLYHTPPPHTHVSAAKWSYSQVTKRCLWQYSQDWKMFPRL